jgi:hypothetical protein
MLHSQHLAKSRPQTAAEHDFHVLNRSRTATPPLPPCTQPRCPTTTASLRTNCPRNVNTPPSYAPRPLYPAPPKLKPVTVAYDDFEFEPCRNPHGQKSRSYGAASHPNSTPPQLGMVLCVASARHTAHQDAFFFAGSNQRIRQTTAQSTC